MTRSLSTPSPVFIRMPWLFAGCSWADFPLGNTTSCLFQGPQRCQHGGRHYENQSGILLTPHCGFQDTVPLPAAVHALLSFVPSKSVSCNCYLWMPDHSLNSLVSSCASQMPGWTSVGIQWHYGWQHFHVWRSNLRLHLYPLFHPLIIQPHPRPLICPNSKFWSSK